MIMWYFAFELPTSSLWADQAPACTLQCIMRYVSVRPVFSDVAVAAVEVVAAPAAAGVVRKALLLAVAAMAQEHLEHPQRALRLQAARPRAGRLQLPQQAVAMALAAAATRSRQRPSLL